MSKKSRYMILKCVIVDAWHHSIGCKRLSLSVDSEFLSIALSREKITLSYNFNESEVMTSDHI